MDGSDATPSLTPQWLLVGSRPPGAGGAPVRLEKEKSGSHGEAKLGPRACQAAVAHRPRHTGVMRNGWPS